MKITKQIPTKLGTQFVVVWEYNGKLFSCTHRVESNGYSEFDNDFNLVGGFVNCRPLKYSNISNNFYYIVKNNIEGVINV